MRYRELTEAPLAGYELYGDWDNEHHHPGIVKAANELIRKDYKGPNSFVSQYDRALIRKPETEAALKKVFARFDFPIWVFFLNSPAGLDIADDYLDHGTLKPNPGKSYTQYRSRAVWDLLPADLRERLTTLAPQNKNGIIVLLTHNEGGEKRHPMTPWMIIHRMVHACAMGEDLDDGKTSSRFYSRNLSIINNAYNPTHVVFERFHMLRSLCTFRAARENNILDNNELELFSEMAVQFIVKGGVILKLPESITMQKRAWPLLPHKRGEAEDALLEIQNTLNEAFAERLKAARGTIVVC